VADVKAKAPAGPGPDSNEQLRLAAAKRAAAERAADVERDQRGMVER
jgi:hypothetical protein